MYIQIEIGYRGRKLKKRYRADFIIDKKVLVDLKGIRKLTEVDEACMINYLKATGLRVGLIINFGRSSSEWKRIVYERDFTDARGGCFYNPCNPWL